MSHRRPPESLDDALRRLAGYVNFSSGPIDAATRSAWNEVFAVASAGDPLSGMPAWLVVEDWLRQTLEGLATSQPAFADRRQADRLIGLLWSEFLPAYLDFHRDLLFHQEPEQLYNGFFLAKAAEALLTVGIDGDKDLVIRQAIDRLDDYVGYRPVAMLENRQCQPYRHEFVCPVPLYVSGSGVTAGPYHDLVEAALDILRRTHAGILRAAAFDPNRLNELALDPRAYDFDHPVNRRPNYHFGGWDERSINADNYYDRFIIRQVTLDALLSRAREEPDTDRDELLHEAATVLAGTILMASGISGWGPGAYSGDVTLASLMKPIAAYRDAFYTHWLQATESSHGRRLADERDRRHQPFGAARQHLNAALARSRAAQLQHVQLARLYARMGYPEAAKRQTDTVAATSSRMICRIDCAMTAGLRALRSGDLATAAEYPEITFDLIRRGIDCGALVDPWDILGFGGNFSLYPGPESGVPDSRVDDLLYLVEQLFGYIARIWSEAAARDDADVYARMESDYREIAGWWREYAAHTVDSIEATDPSDSFESATLVARALRLWHRGGAAAGDVAFWAPHADMFDSPRAYGLVISALVERNDFLPSMALLVHWLGNARRVGLRSGGSSLPRLSERWLLRLRDTADTALPYRQVSIDQTSPRDTREIWPLARKFFDYFEANAEEFWSAPTFALADPGTRAELAGDFDDDDESGSLFDAAYEEMTYRDTTDDGVEGSTFEFGDDGSQDELEAESKRLIEHLTFLQSLARMWAIAADIAVSDQYQDDLADRKMSLRSWAARAGENRNGLLELLAAIRRYEVKPAGSDKESMRSYDRRRVVRDSLMERVINTAVEMSDVRRLIIGVLTSGVLERHEAVDEQTQTDPSQPLAIEGETIPTNLGDDDVESIRMFGALIAGDTRAARDRFPELLAAIRDKRLLYIPVARGGDPRKIFVARLRQRVLQHLMHWLPRRGLVSETCRLIETARLMEQNHPVGAGAVTEFDGLFRTGFRSLIASIVESVRVAHRDLDNSSSPGGTGKRDRAVAEALIPTLERVTETTLASWLAHSQTLRLSPLEMVIDPKKWDRLVNFIRRYGDPLFTQAFLQLGNVRAILHQGVGPWLQRVLEEEPEYLTGTALLDGLQSGELSLSEANRWITLVYESLIDHHAEYLDYNSTTTQSDRGDLVYMFLDFLRLRVRYERIAWNLKPVMWAHDVLVRSGLERSAMMWRRSLSDRIGGEADLYVDNLRSLQRQYAMRMPTVADRILERFVQPMTIDRMRAMVAPAMRDAEAGVESKAFDSLEREAELLTRHPTGVGLDAPPWLQSLEGEVDQLAKQRASSEIDPRALMTIAIVPLTMEQLDNELTSAKSHGRRLPHME